MRNYYLIPAALFLVLLMIGSGCTTSPKPDIDGEEIAAVEETDVNTLLAYTNEEYGFSFQYPRNTVELGDGLNNYHLETDYLAEVEFVEIEKDELGLQSSILFVGIVESMDIVRDAVHPFDPIEESGAIEGKEIEIYSFYTGIGDAGEPNTRVYAVELRSGEVLYLEQS